MIELWLGISLAALLLAYGVMAMVRLIGWREVGVVLLQVVIVGCLVTTAVLLIFAGLQKIST